MALHHYVEAEYFYWQAQSIVLRRFSCTRCEHKSALRVWLWFKNSKSIILWLSHHTLDSVNLRLWGRLWRFILVNQLLFVLNIVIKDIFLVNWNDNLEERVISLPWKKTCYYRFVIIFSLLIKSMRKPNAQIANFFFFFQVASICGFECVEVEC